MPYIDASFGEKCDDRRFATGSVILFGWVGAMSWLSTTLRCVTFST